MHHHVPKMSNRALAGLFRHHAGYTLKREEMPERVGFEPSTVRAADRALPGKRREPRTTEPKAREIGGCLGLSHRLALAGCWDLALRFHAWNFLSSVEIRA